MSSEMATRRTYELKRRAERQEETRRRIVAAAVDLHTTVGPSRATVQAIAEKAGVTRPTVYAHFPDARSLLQACSGHVRETVPPPDPSPWRAIADPSERLENALRELYAYYERLEPLLENVQRDAAVMPLVAEMNAYRVRARLRRAVGHTLEFRTWQSLVRHQGCTTEEAVQLMVAFASGAAPSTPIRGAFGAARSAGRGSARRTR
jgi:AcrR family transcriptional regulator